MCTTKNRRKQNEANNYEMTRCRSGKGEEPRKDIKGQDLELKSVQVWGLLY